jgi:hypothetical protein
MRRLLFTMAILLAGSTACLAQVSTMGSTAMGLSSTPAAIVTSPLNGPSPFSATTQTGTPVTTLAPVPLASNPTTPGTVVTCSTPTGLITPGTPTVQVTAMAATGGTTGTTTSIAAAPTTSVVPTTSSASSTAAPLLLSAQPATSFMSDFPGSTVPVASSAIAAPPPSATTTPISTPSTVSSTVPTSMAGSTATVTPSTTTTISSIATTAAAPLGTISAPIVGSMTGTISPVSVLGSPSTTVCSSIPGGPPTNGAALPLSTPEIPANPAPGTIQPDITQLGNTSIDPTTAGPTMTVVPTPNTSACAENTMMNDLATPGTMAPANATGAAATPGVSSPSGC